MRTPRIYIPTNVASAKTADPAQDIAQHLQSGSELAAPKDTGHYLLKVLRLSDGAPLIVFNGEGGEYRATLKTDKKAAVIVIDDFIAGDRSSPLAIHLGIGLSRGERMDWIIQKATELGVDRITPLFTERCEVKLQGERLQKRHQHWHKVAVSACEQSGRNRLPGIESASSLNEWLAAISADLRLVMHPGQPALPSPASKPQTVALLIGPEGGLTNVEVDQAKAAGFESFGLGPRILRTETAPLAALSVLQYCWGDFG